MPPLINRLFATIRWRAAAVLERQRLGRLTRQVAAHAVPSPEQPPVVIFNASTRLNGLSQNAAFALLTGWSLRLMGVPVVHFVCHSGMSHCVLGTSRQDHRKPPPCPACIAQSRRAYAGAEVQWFSYTPNPELSTSIQNLSLEELMAWKYPAPFSDTREEMPLGALVLPSIRWALRRHTLPDDEPARYLYRQYILSAESVARQFATLILKVQPQAVVLFNGIFYPEAAARWVARQLGIRSVTHEVAYRQFSVFFTDGESTAYPIHIPKGYELSDEQNARLDAYLEQRFKGRFSMAGIRFWPEMRGLDHAFLQKASGFRQIVPVFTNVIYDTSQVHANILFPHMFAWLDQVAEIIRRHPETLFVIRAHPDEMRPGSDKQSQESVRNWVRDNHLEELKNVVFIDSREYISSYELIERSKFVMVYNSSIGLEASLMGKMVLCAGKARYTQYPTVIFPQTQSEYLQTAEEFLRTEELIAPPELAANSRRFMYFQMYRASLPLEEYLENGRRMGFVRFKPLSWEKLLPENSPTLRVITEGILHNRPFLMPDA